MSGGRNLTTEEIQNIYKSYEHFGAERLAEFIQSVWEEAYDEGFNEGSTQS